MTLHKLLKLLQEWADAGHGRAKVVVDKTTLWDGNGTFNLCAIKDVVVLNVTVFDDDGYHIENKDGSHRTQRVAMLTGGRNVE